MTAVLRLLDDEGEEVTPGASNPLDLGAALPGGGPLTRRIALRNAGDASVHFARVRAAPHPTAQTGAGRDTYAATTLSLHERGDFRPELDLGTLEPGESRPFWVRWTPPPGAPPGLAVWAVEALASET